LEVVQVDEQDRRLFIARGLLEAVLKAGAVGQAGERIVEGPLAQTLAHLVALGYVPAVEDDPVHPRVGVKVAEGSLEPAHRAVGVTPTTLDRLHRAVVAD